MRTTPDRPSTRLLPLFLAWLALVALTLASLGLGEWLGSAGWLPLLVAVIIWVKAWLVAHYFLEVRLSRALIRRIIWAFIAFAPIALALTDRFGRQFAEWAQL